MSDEAKQPAGRAPEDTARAADEAARAADEADAERRAEGPGGEAGAADSPRRLGRRIRIGSRRGPKKVRSVRPTLSLDPSMPRPAAPSPAAGETPPAADQGAPEAAPPEAAASEAAKSEAVPADRGDAAAPRGSSSPPEAPPAAGVVAGASPESEPAAAPRPVAPRPSRRDPLPPELEQQVAAALGDASLEEVLGSAGEGEAPDSLPLESRHAGVVMKIHRDNVFFSLGGRNEGVASLRQFREPPQVGQRLDVIVSGYNAEENLYELTIPGGSVSVEDWSDLVEGTLVEARVTGANTGGLEVMVNQLRGFIPASQIAMVRVENLSHFIGEKMLCVVLEVNRRRRKLVLSRRAVLEREREEAKRRRLEELEPGQTCEGVVRSLRDFGAFVDLGGVDGLIHIRQLSWERIQHPSEVLQEGQKVRVRIESVDRQTGRISLSYRDLMEDPWADVEQRFPVNAVVPGVVSRIANFGAFVKLAPGVEGLVHISELAHQRVHQVSSVVREGQEVQVKVLSVDREAQRIGLSLKGAMPAPEKPRGEGKESERERPRELAVKPARGPLRGGTGRRSGGEQFGLKW